MKLSAIVVLAFALFWAALTTSAVRTLAEFTGFSVPHLTKSNLVTGKAHHVYLADETWQRFPAAPWPMAPLIDLRAFGIVAAVVLAVIYVGRFTLRLPWSVAGLCVMAASALPYALGARILASNTALATAGPWLATMLMSLLYGSVACAVLALLDIVPLRRLLSGRVRSDAMASTPAQIQGA